MVRMNFAGRSVLVNRLVARSGLLATIFSPALKGRFPWS